MQNLAFIDQLKTVTIELCSGSNGIELAKYVLELQEMVILLLPQHMAKLTSLTTTLMGFVFVFVLCFSRVSGGRSIIRIDSMERKNSLSDKFGMGIALFA